MLTKATIDALLSVSEVQTSAVKLGTAIVDLGFADPAALACTLTILGDELVISLSAEEILLVRPCLLALLGAIAAGFANRAQATASVEHERVRKDLAVACRELDTRLHAVLSSAPIIFFVFDRAGIITILEGRGLSTLKRRPGDLISRSIWEGVSADPQLAECVRRALAGESCAARSRIRGEVLSTQFIPQRDEAGELVSVIGVSVVITEQAHGEAVSLALALGLSPTELRVLDLLGRADLRSYRAIGQQLFRSGETVRDHMQSIAHKLNVAAQRAVVVDEARRRGLLHSD